MGGVDTFDLADIDDNVMDGLTKEPTTIPELEELENWAAAAVNPDRSDSPVFWDIETGPMPEGELRAMAAPFVPPPHPGEFDPGTVKTGNAGPEKAAEKIEKAREAHQKAIADYDADCKVAEASWWMATVEKAALSPVTGRVLLIGCLRADGFYPLSNDADEATLLDDFWGHVDSWLVDKRPIIGHNTNGFDWPFLIRRSWILGVPVPREVRQGRYWNPLFRDTQEQWFLGSRELIKLNTLAAYFGVGQKTEGVSGANFHRFWFGQMEGRGTPEEQRKLALEYCEQDVRLTAAIAAKMGMA